MIFRQKQLTMKRMATIVLGRFYVDDHDNGDKYGRATIDYLIFWNKPLSENERNLLHQ